MQVVFAGGGSGGHLAPGIAVAKALAARRADVEMLFLTSERPLDAQMLDKADFAHAALPAEPWESGKMFSFAWSSSRAYARALWRFSRHRPALVVGLGGFASVFPCLAARAAGVPLVLLEQNTVPGRANAFLASRAAAVLAGFEEARGKFPPQVRVVVTGNPVLPGINHAMPLAGLTHFTLAVDRRTLLVLGGSQGAHGLNAKVIENAGVIGRAGSRVQVIHQTGEADADAVRAAWAAAGVRAVVLPFIDRMDLAYAAADFAICRAGAMTLAELAEVGLPAMLVPLPTAAGDHQTRNAAAYADAGAALMISQERFSAATMRHIVDLMLNGHLTLNEITARLARRRSRNAVEAILREIEPYLAAKDASERACQAC
ncbi:MAG: UDP-N-acetylglucosamine--N-acetylmuramyl-(pentapeptide) pyrophosphoryl-undecaprenol N-acetylglucosamine transferase [Planctomycetes bacterium]|nr:UDP-N-acetylglucosamine--N-acetylmuramyl-(pentapeptide) pyrophosphoryl-undecaprenol N-acetylglucosamine transferase [Planctomycetota bacterium]